MVWKHRDDIASDTLLKICKDIGRKRLAKMLGVTQSCICQWINGYRKISLEYALQIAEITGDSSHVKKLYSGPIKLNKAFTDNNENNPQEESTDKEYIKIDMIQQAPQLLQLPAALYVVPEITKDTSFPVIIDKHYHLLAFPERLQAYKALGDTTVPALLVDVELHLKNKTPIELIDKHCTLSQKSIAALVLQHFYAIPPGRPSKKSKKTLGKSNELKTHKMSEIIQCVGLKDYEKLKSIVQVIKLGCKKLIERMDKVDGKTLPFSTICEIAKQPHNKQRELIQLGKEALRDWLKKIKPPKKRQVTAIEEKAQLIIPIESNQASIQSVCHELIELKASFSCIRRGSSYILTFNNSVVPVPPPNSLNFQKKLPNYESL
ncbi:MAG: YdaS family helix-turn-helix protein [Gammaproteobacteria bacterium]